ncbi:TPA: hypothetical protein SFZ49_001936 [Campylobacter jejuni]|nr:hypothetical protein [Campylobacter jejuni]
MKIVKIEGECDYIPLEKSSGYSNGLFQDDALHLNTTHLLSVVNHRNDNEIEE